MFQELHLYCLFFFNIVYILSHFEKPNNIYFDGLESYIVM